MINFRKIDLKQLAVLIYEALRQDQLDAVLVGGACVSIYTENRYQSYDLDFVSHEELKNITKALAKIGFRRQGRYFVHDDCPYFIDFVNPPVAVGHQPVRQFKELRTEAGRLQLLTPKDCVKDRLAAYFHWNDLQTLDQAVLVAQHYPVDLVEIGKWAEQEGHKTKFETFRTKLGTN